LVGIRRIKRMLRIDESSLSTDFLYFSDGMEGYRRLTGRFRSIYFNNAASWKSANTKCYI
ncbi:hypothetical protein BGX30_014760, partial [Mortierella sp. GBA39]